MRIAVRKHAEWMSKNDDRILEYLASNPGKRPHEIRTELSDAAIALQPRYIDKRLELLERAALVRKDGLRYELSDHGRAYLVGEYAVESIA